jgi:hypothetical protein
MFMSRRERIRETTRHVWFAAPREAHDCSSKTTIAARGLVSDVSRRGGMQLELNGRESAMRSSGGVEEFEKRSTDE